VLVLLATREGTSATIIENRREDSTFEGHGKELYFNDAGRRAVFAAERRRDVAARIARRGGPTTAAERSALGRGADMIAIVQVPLVHEDRGLLGGAFPWGDYAYEFSDDHGMLGPDIRVRPGPVRTGGDLDRAVIGHGPVLGPYVEGRGKRLVRDVAFPIRITVQFYKATSDGIVGDRDLDALATTIRSVYAHADYVGSLVLPDGDERRPTAWQSFPGEWFPW
jgi:hypothetical protein